MSIQELLEKLPAMIYEEDRNYELQIGKKEFSGIFYCGYYDFEDRILCGWQSRDFLNLLETIYRQLQTKGDD